MKQKLLKPLQGMEPTASAYETNIGAMYTLVRSFVAEAEADKAVRDIAKELLGVVPESGYVRYARLVCLRAVFDYLKKRPKESHDAADATAPIKGLDFDDAFCIVLRDELGLTCAEIAAVVGTSEGSIRTRLERIRRYQFKDSVSQVQQGSTARQNGAHVCSDARIAIEDWSAEDDDRNKPDKLRKSLAALAQGCDKCHEASSLRAVSLAHFGANEKIEVPEALKKFPISPLLSRQGRRLLLNWSSAPWYVKAALEGLLATAVILVVVLAVPKAKKFYELWLERRLDLYTVAELAIGLTGNSGSMSGAPQAATSTADAEAQAGIKPIYGPVPEAEQSAAEHVSVKPKSEFLGRDAEIPSTDRLARILIKTDAPETLKPHVLQILSGGSYTAADKEEPMGAELPGGILFDVFVPIKSYPSIVQELSRLGDAQVLITRSRQRGVVGKARMKIWLQRI